MNLPPPPERRAWLSVTSEKPQTFFSSQGQGMSPRFSSGQSSADSGIAASHPDPLYAAFRKPAHSDEEAASTPSYEPQGDSSGSQHSTPSPSPAGKEEWSPGKKAPPARPATVSGTGEDGEAVLGLALPTGHICGACGEGHAGLYELRIGSILRVVFQRMSGSKVRTSSSILRPFPQIMGPHPYFVTIRTSSSDSQASLLKAWGSLNHRSLSRRRR